MVNKTIFNDARSHTYETRIKIGFDQSLETWKHQPIQLDDEKLVIMGHPVMESWEDNYMLDLSRIACARGGRVLEVGFGMGISARHIQSQEIDEHIVIEANGQVYLELLKFSFEQKKLVRPIFGMWQDVISYLPDASVDGILFDTYPLTVEEIHKNHFFFFEQAYRVLRKGGVFTYYSDEIDTFSVEHLHKLHEAGFRDISGRICEVVPPADCQYWTSPTILSPIIIK